jgi:hypothetical protein
MLCSIFTLGKDHILLAFGFQLPGLVSEGKGNRMLAGSQTTCKKDQVTVKRSWYPAGVKPVKDSLVELLESLNIQRREDCIYDSTFRDCRSWQYHGAHASDQFIKFD